MLGQQIDSGDKEIYSLRRELQQVQRAAQAASPPGKGEEAAAELTRDPRVLEREQGEVSYTFVRPNNYGLMGKPS